MVQCNVEIDNLDQNKNYSIYVGGRGEKDKPAKGSKIISGSTNTAIIDVLAEVEDTYKLGIWVFEGADPDIIKPSKAAWQGNPVEIVVS